MVYQLGINYTAVLQIDPVVPCDVLFSFVGGAGVADSPSVRVGEEGTPLLNSDSAISIS